MDNACEFRCSSPSDLALEIKQSSAINSKGVVLSHSFHWDSALWWFNSAAILEVIFLCCLSTVMFRLCLFLLMYFSSHPLFLFCWCNLFMFGRYGKNRVFFAWLFFVFFTGGGIHQYALNFWYVITSQTSACQPSITNDKSVNYS